MLGNYEKKLPYVMGLSGESTSERQHLKEIVTGLLRDRYFWYVVTLAIFIGIFAYAPEISASIGLGPRPDWELSYYIALYRVIFVLSAAIAAWRYGIKGGLVTTGLLAPIVFSPVILGLREINILLELGLVIVGIMVSFLIGRQGYMQKLLKTTANELQQQTLQLKQEIAERKRAEEEIKVLSLRAIESLVFALEAKDKYTAGHSRQSS